MFVSRAPFCIFPCMQMKLAISLIAFGAVALFADGSLQFANDPYKLGTIPQGEVRHVTLKGANVTSKTIELESAMCQGTGCSNFKFTQSVAARAPITVDFDFSTASMDGPVSNLVVLVGKDGKPYTASFEGTVEAPVFFNEKMFDAGYYSAGESREWTFYAWSADKKKQIALALDSSAGKEFSAAFKPVKLTVGKDGSVKEGGKVPGLKVTLRTAGIDRSKTPKNQKSISRVVPFRSSTYPNATPEALVIGYWK